MTDYTRLGDHLNCIRGNIVKDPGYPYHEKLIDRSFTAFAGMDKNGKDVLDVGIGTGYSLRKFKENGFKVIGITMNDEEVNDAKLLGYDVRLMDMAFLEFEDQSFDLVWCRHALEHSVMPFIALLEFHRTLRVGGFVYIEVPSNCIFSIEIDNHFSLFSDEAWQALFRRAGFSLRHRGQYMSIKHIAPDTKHDLTLHDNYWYYIMRKETN